MATKPYTGGGAYINRMARQVEGAARLGDLREVVAQEKDRGRQPT